MTFRIATTPFHARMAEHNSGNAWVEKAGYTVPAHFGDWMAEALAARFSTVLADITPISDLRIHGEGAAAFLSAGCRSDLSTLGAGETRAVHWLADGGGVRGIGAVSRFGPDNFLLRAIEADLAWFAAAAPRFGANVRDATAERGLLWLAGPFAFAVLAAAELEDAARLEAGEHTIARWRGATVTVFHTPDQGEYQISCGNSDARAVFDRLVHAGRLFGLRLAGERAADVLTLEAGRVVPGEDFVPARSPFASEPAPASLGLAEGAKPAAVLVGIALDSDAPAAFATVHAGNAEIGRTMRSLYSPAARRALALAAVAPAHAEAGTKVSVLARGEEIAGQVATLPFLK